MSKDALAELLALRDKPTRRVIGLMSGTSADGVDAALVEISAAGVGTQVQLVAFDCVPIPSALKRRIWNLPDDQSANLGELNFLLGEAFGQAAIAIADQAGLGIDAIDLIGSHGQTARHQPPGTTQTPYTVQIGEAAVIAEHTGRPVISDFRVADVAAGGHGAPLIPLVDYLLFRQRAPLALLNLGGIANVTVVTPQLDDVFAFDIGPANMALDAVARAQSHGAQAYDPNGQGARRGQVDQALLADLLRHPFFALAPPKSTGREIFGRDFVYPLLDRCVDRLDDLLATLVALTAQTISDAFARAITPVVAVSHCYVSGGGRHNSALMEAIQRTVSGVAISGVDALGCDPDAKEALGFAVLANETLFGHCGNLPRATGARGPRVLGKIALPGGR